MTQATETQYPYKTYAFTLNIGFFGAERNSDWHPEEAGYSQEAWDALSDGEKHEVLNDCLQCWADEYIDTGWE